MAKVNRALANKQFSSLEEVNAFLQAAFGDQGGEELVDFPLSPLDAAQELIYDAWEEPARRKRIALAKKALKLSPDCADAYVILAEDEAERLEEAERLYAEGVKAGERALGREKFKSGKGHFWGLVETRPYMRARSRLAMTLWDLGRRAEAIDHMWAMLALDPEDHLGLRYLLISWLLLEGRDQEIKKLARKFGVEPTATWLYPLALWTFRQEGASTRANRRLVQAFKANPYVAAFMLGAKKPPKRLPESYTLGSEAEAVEYLLDGGEAWVQTPGAGDWLVEQLTALMAKDRERK